MAAIKKTKASEWQATDEYIRLRTAILDDLTARGMVTEYYADLLDQYMCLWCNYRMLRENIEQRGVMVTYSNGAQKGMTDNKSVALKNQVHKQMLAIGDALGYREQMRVSKPGGDADNEPL